MIKKNKKVAIEPLYVKNEKGKTISVYLDIKAYDAIIKKVNEFDVIKKKIKKKAVKK